MEIIITLVVLALAAYWVYDLSQKQKQDSDTKLDNWQPPKDLTEQPWPYGEKLPEGKIHVKPAELSGSQNRVEEPAPSIVAETVTTVVENKPTKKAPTKKTADKKPAAKRAPAKKKST